MNLYENSVVFIIYFSKAYKYSNQNLYINWINIIPTEYCHFLIWQFSVNIFADFSSSLCQFRE